MQHEVMLDNHELKLIVRYACIYLVAQWPFH